MINIFGFYINLVVVFIRDLFDKFFKFFGYVLLSNIVKGYFIYFLWDGFYYVCNNLIGVCEVCSFDFFFWDKGVNISYMEIFFIDECLLMKGFYFDD